MPDQTVTHDLVVGSLVTAKHSPVSNINNSFSTPIEGVVRVAQTGNNLGRRTIRVAKIEKEGEEEKITPIPGMFYADLFNPA